MRRARCVTLAVGGAPGAAELGAEGLGQSLQHRRVGWAEYEGQRALRDGTKGEEGAQEGILLAARAPGVWAGHSAGMEGPRPGLDPRDVGKAVGTEGSDRSLCRAEVKLWGAGQGPWGCVQRGEGILGVRTLGSDVSYLQALLALHK